MTMSIRNTLADVTLSAYEWSDEFSKGQPRAYRQANYPFVTSRPLESAHHSGPKTTDELIDLFLSVLGDSEMPHRPSEFQSLELEAVCAPMPLQILEDGIESSVTYPLALLDDRCRLGSQFLEAPISGQQRENAGPLSSAQLLQELKKKVS